MKISRSSEPERGHVLIRRKVQFKRVGGIEQSIKTNT